jgi:hypothetical protein
MVPSWTFFRVIVSLKLVASSQRELDRSHSVVPNIRGSDTKVEGVGGTPGSQIWFSSLRTKRTNYVLTCLRTCWYTCMQTCLHAWNQVTSTVCMLMFKSARDRGTVPWRSVHPQTDHVTFQPKLSVHPTNWQTVCCDNLLLWHSSTYMIRPRIFRPPRLQGGRFVTCDITSTLPKILCDIMSTLSWSKIWTVCHNILGPICDVLPAVWRHVDVLSQDFSPTRLHVQPAFQRSVDVLSPYFWTSVMSRPPAQQTVDVLSQDLWKKERNLMRQSL